MSRKRLLPKICYKYFRVKTAYCNDYPKQLVYIAYLWDKVSFIQENKTSNKI